MAPQDILVDNLKEALKAAHQYIIWGTGIALFLLVLVIQDWRGTGVAAIIKLPAIGVDAERSLVELIASVACFISGYMAYLAVERVSRIRVRLRAWPEIRKAALTYPSIPTINSGMRIAAVLLPALLFSAALMIILVPLFKEKGTFIIPAGITLILNSPYILIAQLLRYPLGETSYQLTKLSLCSLKEEDLPGDILEKLKQIGDREYKNRPMFLKALGETIGGKQADKHKSLILRHACVEEMMED